MFRSECVEIGDDGLCEWHCADRLGGESSGAQWAWSGPVPPRNRRPMRNLRSLPGAVLFSRINTMACAHSPFLLSLSFRPPLESSFLLLSFSFVLFLSRTPVVSDRHACN